MISESYQTHSLFNNTINVIIRLKVNSVTNPSVFRFTLFFSLRTNTCTRVCYTLYPLFQPSRNLRPFHRWWLNVASASSSWLLFSLSALWAKTPKVVRDFSSSLLDLRESRVNIRDSPELIASFQQILHAPRRTCLFQESQESWERKRGREVSVRSNAITINEINVLKDETIMTVYWWIRRSNRPLVWFSLSQLAYWYLTRYPLSTKPCEINQNPSSLSHEESQSNKNHTYPREIIILLFPQRINNE